MIGGRAGLGWRGLLAAVAGLILGVQAPAWAQSDGWSFVVTPQVWLSHISKNGFAAPADGGGNLGGFFIVTKDQSTIVDHPLQNDSSSKNDINPQWGIQLGAQHGRLTLSGAFQYVDFDSRNDLTYVHPQGLPFCLFVGANSSCVNSGERWAVEKLETQRIDIELSG